jgi:hypothetical protein
VKIRLFHLSGSNDSRDAIASLLSGISLPAPIRSFETVRTVKLEQISADLNREGDSQVTLDERFWRH